MSNDISYVIKVVDDFSANLKKFQSGVGAADVAASKFTSNLNKNYAGLTSLRKGAQDAAYLGINPYSNAILKAGKSTQFFTDNLKDLGKAAGIYVGLNSIAGFAKGVFNTTMKIDSLKASFSAILPKFDKTKDGAQLAAEEMQYLQEVTQKLGVRFESFAPNYLQSLANSNFTLQETRGIMESIAGLARLMGATPMQEDSALYAINQMMGKGRIQAQEFSLQLSQALPKTREVFLKAAQLATGNQKMTMADFLKIMENGRMGAGILKYVAQVIQRDYGDAIIKKSHTIQGEVNRTANSFVFLKKAIGDEFKPTLNSTILELNKFAGGAADVFAAISNDNAFTKLNEDLKAITTMLRIAKGLMQGFGEELSLIGKIVGGAWQGAKDVVKAGTITAYAATGGDKDIAKGAYQELWQQMLSRYSNDNKTPEVNITVNKAASDTTVEVSSPKKSSSLRTGNMTNYQEAY